MMISGVINEGKKNMVNSHLFSILYFLQVQNRQTKPKEKKGSKTTQKKNTHKNCSTEAPSLIFILQEEKNNIGSHSEKSELACGSLKWKKVLKLAGQQQEKKLMCECVFVCAPKKQAGRGSNNNTKKKLSCTLRVIL